MFGWATLWGGESPVCTHTVSPVFSQCESVRTAAWSYRVLFSGVKRAARPSASLFSTSLSDFGFLKSDGRFRIWTSFLNCWHRAFCWQGTKREEVKQSHPRSTRKNFIRLHSPVELLLCLFLVFFFFFCCPAQKIYNTVRITLLSNDLHY